MGNLLKQRTYGSPGIDIGPSDKDSENFTVGQGQTGLLDMARVNLSVFNSVLPATIIPSLPFVFRSAAHMRRVLDGPIGQQILTSTENRGLIGLCFYDAGARSFYSTHRPIRHVDSYEVAARLKAEAAGVKVIDDVDRKSFADVLVPLYPTLAPQPRLQAMVQQAQADGDIASEP